MKRIAHELIHNLDSGINTAPIEIPLVDGSPAGIDGRLFRAMKTTDVWPDAESIQLVKELAGGHIAELVVRVDRIRIRGEKDKFVA